MAIDPLELAGACCVLAEDNLEQLGFSLNNLKLFLVFSSLMAGKLEAWPENVPPFWSLAPPFTCSAGK